MINNINAAFAVSITTEIHDHQTIHDSWDGNITSGVTGDILSNITAEMVNSTILSYTTIVANAMSNTVLAGGKLDNIFKSGFQSMTDKDTLKSTQSLVSPLG